MRDAHDRWVAGAVHDWERLNEEPEAAPFAAPSECYCAGCQPEHPRPLPRCRARHCIWCGGHNIKTVLDGERWCHDCQQYL